ncbi:MAG: D-aminoacyl-tRNA deacylase [Spirochaetaceae bacterium]
MRAVVQRVFRGAVRAEGVTTGTIGPGLFVLLGIGRNDGEEELTFMVEKVLNLRLFEDEEGKMNRSLLETGGELLVVSQFTLYGDARKGRRPSYNRAASPEHARPLYQQFLQKASDRVKVGGGSFGDHMDIDLQLNGPVTVLLDSEKQF